MKKILNFWLIATMIIGLGMSVTSCKGDNDDGKTEEQKQEEAQEKASKFWDVVANLNAFARTLREEVFKNPSISIYDLYRELARTTTGSHVNIYNQQQYGSVYEETMLEYFPK